MRILTFINLVVTKIKEVGLIYKFFVNLKFRTLVQNNFKTYSIIQKMLMSVDNDLLEFKSRFYLNYDFKCVFTEN